MKNIFVLGLIIVLSVITNSVKAQSFQKLKTEWQQKMEATKKHREEVLQKAQEQGLQQQAEKRPAVNFQQPPVNNGSNRQKSGATGEVRTPVRSQNQPLLKKGQSPVNTEKSKETNQ
jgi:hypothetical protein